MLSGKAEPVLRSGQPLRRAAQTLRDLGAEVMLINCTLAEFMKPAIRIVRDVLAGHPLAGHIGACANTFVPVPEGEDRVAANGGLCHLRGDLKPGQYADMAQGWIAAGASYAGGCCGIGPEHICALHEHHAH